MGTDYVVRLSGKDDLSNTIKNVKKELNEFGSKAKEVDKIDAKFNRIIQSTAPLKRQLRDLQGLMAKMNMDGLTNTEQFTKIAQHAGAIRDAIGDASQAVNKFASDTSNLDASIQAFQGLAATASIATGAMALFGKENQNVNEAIKKVQGALGILNGVQSVANVLNKDSALMLKLASIQLKASTVATNLETAAKGKNLIATKAATVAQRALNFVAKANPYVLLASAVIAVGAAYLKFANGAKVAKISDEQLNQELKNTEKEMQGIEDKADFDVAIAEASGKSAREIYKIRLEAKKAKQALAELGLSKAESRYFNGEVDKSEVDKWQDKLNEAFADVNKTIMDDFRNQQIEKIKSRTKKSSKSVSTSSTKNTDKPFDYNKEFNKNLGKNSTDLESFVNDTETKLQELKEHWESLFKPKTSSFNSFIPKQNDTTTLKGIEQEMNMNDSMIESLNELIAKYKELGDVSSVNQLTAQVEGLKKANDELGNSAVRISEKQKLTVKEQERYNEEMAKMGTIKDTISSVESAFNGLGSAIGGSGGEMLKFGAQIMESTANIIPQIIKLIGAKQAEATASGTASAAKLPFPANIGAIATIVAQIAAIFAALPKFADGGIVGGSSYSGDKLFARVNSGEMIFNKRQQRNLFNLIDNGNIGYGANITFKLRGADLYGSMANYSKTVSKIGKVTGIK